MGINNSNILNPIKDFEESWNGKSGLAVEDFICTLIKSAQDAAIVGGEYRGLKLYLKTAAGTELEEIPITVATPKYTQDIVFYGIRVKNGNTTLIYDNSDALVGALCQYKNDEDTKVEAGIAIRSISHVVGTDYDSIGDFTVNVHFEGENKRELLTVKSISLKYFTLVNGKYLVNVTKEEAELVINWYDITSLFKTYISGKYLQVDLITDDGTKSSKLSVPITNEILDLNYTGQIITTSEKISIGYKTVGLVYSGHTLVGYNINSGGQTPIEVKADNNNIPFSLNLHPGLNQICVRVQHSTYKNIASEWLNVDIIYVSEDFKGTAIAVNGVSLGILNNGVATLYRLDIYSTTREEFRITTYLEDSSKTSASQLTNIIKDEYITSSQYNREDDCIRELSYQKYIEVDNTGTDTWKYLYILINGNIRNFYSVYYYERDNRFMLQTTYSLMMEIEKCIPEYMYIKHYSVSKNFDQITGQINNLFSTSLQSGSNATLIDELETSDGWKEAEGLSYLKLSNLGKKVLKNPINLGLSNSFTIEMAFRTYNISDESQSILNIGPLTLYPTLLGWDFGDGDLESAKFLKRNAQFLEDVKTHIVISVEQGWLLKETDPYYPTYVDEVVNDFKSYIKKDTARLNLVRIYINGCIDREISITNDELRSLQTGTLNIYPKSADIDLYLFRVYNENALNGKEVILNYIAYLPDKTGELSKQSVFEKNDILDSNGRISWTLCLGKQNTLLFIYHKNGKFPHRFWGKEDNDEDVNDWNKEIPCTLVINYANEETNLQYGGVLDKLLCKGLGSSAMRYLIWNVNSSLNKLAYEDENGEEQEVDSTFRPFGKVYLDSYPSLLPKDDTRIYNTIEGYYPMPAYTDLTDKTVYEYTKMVGKVNFASSMLSHKIGACKLFDDAYKESVLTTLPSGGRKAVHEEPFLYFYIETDEPFEKDYSSNFGNSLTDTVTPITYEKILELGDKSNFMGFLTWGPGKGDKPCSGFNKKTTPEYLMLEGGENTDPSVNFQRPWHALQRLNREPDGSTFTPANLNSIPTVTKAGSQQDASKNLLILDESIVYMTRGAWDIDFGVDDFKVNGTKYYYFTDGAKVSLLKFREFYDTVYLYDSTFNVEENQEANGDLWDINRKYYLVNANVKLTISDRDDKGQIIATNTHSLGNNAGDVYRYNEPTKTWVKAGLYYDHKMNDWETLNYLTILSLHGHSIMPNNYQTVRQLLLGLFEDVLEEKGYLHTDDIAFHQAFIKFISGTDNRAKNTYYLIIGTIYDKEGLPTEKGDYKVRMLGDDLDTIFVTDNNGLLSKPYNLIEDSYDESLSKYWGDVGNIFLRQFDKVYESEIQTQLKAIMTKAGMNSADVNNKNSYFYKTFFKVLEDFPLIAYNHTATIYYENALVIKDCGAPLGFVYTNNDVEPIELSHGSCLEGERLFMKKRISFLAGYAKSCLDYPLSTSASASSGANFRLKLDFVPSLDFYPTYDYEKDVTRPIGTNYYNYSESDTKYDILNYKAVKGKRYLKDVSELGTAINLRINQVNLYKELSLTGLLIDSVKGDFLRTTSLTLDNKIILNNSNFFGEGYPILNLKAFDANVPVIETLNIKNVKVNSAINLSNFHKLQVIDFSDSDIPEVTLPQTNVLRSVILPSTISALELYNNPGLESLVLLGTNNLRILYIDCARCGKFDVETFLEELLSTVLSNVTLRNLNNLNITEEALDKLLNCPNLSLLGSITIINSTTNKTKKDIKFSTLKRLVEKFGNIRSGDNILKIDYQESNLKLMIYPGVVQAFYTGKSEEEFYPDLFNIDFTSGNKIGITTDGKLNITYRAINFPSTAELVDTTTGTIKVTGNSNVQNAAVEITVGTSDGSLIKTDPTIQVLFEWREPQLGDFAYADGTFSHNYIRSKKLVGLVYKKDKISDISGTVYIIGCEYSNDTPHYIGPLSYSQSNLMNNTDEFNKNEITKYINSFTDSNLLLFSTKEKENNVPTTITTTVNFNYLKGSITNTKNPDLFKTVGQEDTYNYIRSLAESEYFNNLLTIDGLNLNTLINNSTNEFLDTNSLNLACENLDNKWAPSGTQVKKYNSAILYPYFYSAYLYEPQSEELDPLYSRGKWYAPSIYEMSLILYYRLISAKAKDSLPSAIDVGYTINNNLTSAEYDESTAIFSLAKNRMKANVNVWENLANNFNLNGVGYSIVNSKNPVTTKTSTTGWSAENYSYLLWDTKDTYTPSEYKAEWIAGDSNFADNIWTNEDERKHITGRYAKHQGIPFTHYNYVKP